MNPERPYRLAPSVALRPERFGALIYSHDTRRLYFLHSHAAAAFVGSLDGKRPLGEAVARFVAAQADGDAGAESLLQTMARLERLGVVGPA